MNDAKPDSIVVGGGPGGATLASLVAMQGHRVSLLEHEIFPRYQIGESLLPATVHGICRMLGVEDELRKANFVRKNGAAFRWGKGAEPWLFGFSQARLLDAIGANYAYQVERSKFDEILLRNAARLGVRVEEGCKVQKVLREGDRVVGVRYIDANDRPHDMRGTFVADASGNGSHIYREVGDRRYSAFFRNIALFGYFEDGGRLPSPNQGNILCEAFDKGWIWYIPLSLSPPFLTSVGAVIAHDFVEEIQSNPETAMRGFIAACPKISGLLARARRVTEGQYGRYRVRKDWSYTNERFFGPGMCLVGDAACFIDPVLSTGVHLATYSALLAARSVNSTLRGDVAESTAFAEFERRYRLEYETFYRYLLAFYDMHREDDSYFWEARKVLNTAESANEAFARLVAGGATDPGVYFRARAGVGDKLQDFADQLGLHVSPEERERLTREMSSALLGDAKGDRIAGQAGLEDLRSAWQGAVNTDVAADRHAVLEPSSDGFHWAPRPVGPAPGMAE